MKLVVEERAVTETRMKEEAEVEEVEGVELYRSAMTRCAAIRRAEDA